VDTVSSKLCKYILRLEITNKPDNIHSNNKRNTDSFKKLFIYIHLFPLSIWPFFFSTHYFKGNSCIVSDMFFRLEGMCSLIFFCYGKVKLLKNIIGFDTQLGLWECPSNMKSIYIIIIDSNDV